MTTGIDGLTPCPFCGAGVTRIDEHRHWTGMRYQVLSVEVRHWCAPSGALPRAYISCTGKTTEEAVEKWNTRVHKAAKSEEKPCPDCAEMTKQRDHYREQSRANSSGQLAEELSCALARIERLELVRAVGILEIQCAIDVLYDRLGSGEKISRVVLELEQRLAGKGGEFPGRGGQDFVGGDAVHNAPPALTRSEVLLRRLSAS